MAFLSEADIEQGLLELLQSLGWATTSDDLIGPDGKAPERESHDVVVLHQRLAAAVARLNPHLPMEARSDAIRKLTQSELPNLLEENRRVHQLLTEGVDVEYYANDGVLTAGKVLLLDFDRPENNDWLAVQQLVVISGQHQRRPDVALFVNGLPLAVIELKAPGSAGANLGGVQPIADLQTTDCRAVPNQCLAGHIRRHHGAGGIAVGRSGTLHAVAHHRWQERIAQGPAGAADTDRRRVRAAPLSGSAALVHRLWRDRKRAGQDHCGLPPVPRGQPRRRFHHPCSRFEP